MRVRVLILFVPWLLTLSGCGQTLGGPDGSYPQGIVWNHRFYGADEMGVSKVGKQIGQVSRHVNHMLTNAADGTVSNSYPVGTKIYKAPGKDITEAIAVKDSQGKYVEIDVLPK